MKKFISYNGNSTKNESSLKNCELFLETKYKWQIICLKIYIVLSQDNFETVCTCSVVTRVNKKRLKPGKVPCA